MNITPLKLAKIVALNEHTSLAVGDIASVGGALNRVC
jgi:hypothetical protein